MEVYVRKDFQAFSFASFTELKLDNHTRDYCCEKLEKYTSITKSWNSKIGKFSIVEKDNFVPIDYCPFCGEKLEYICVE